MGEQIHIPITKAGKGVVFVFDKDELAELPDEVYSQVFQEGLKVFLNSRMSKLEAPSKLTGAALEDASAKALDKAAENLRDLKAGKLLKRSAATKATAGVDRAVMTEALRLAKEVVKNEIRKAGMKISHVPAKDITAAAKIQVEGNPKYLADAAANIAERAKIPSVGDIKSLITESPKLVAEAEARKAEKAKSKGLSAKQAGIPTKRAGAKVPPRRPGPPDLELLRSGPNLT